MTLLVNAAIAVQMIVLAVAFIGTFFGPWRNGAAVVAGTLSLSVLLVGREVYRGLTDPGKIDRTGFALFYGFFPFLALLVLGLALGCARKPDSLLSRYLLGLATGGMAWLIVAIVANF